MKILHPTDFSECAAEAMAMDLAVKLDEYPERCVCGGLVHATAGDEQDQNGDPVLTTECDRCGRSKERS